MRKRGTLLVGCLLAQQSQWLRNCFAPQLLTCPLLTSSVPWWVCISDQVIEHSRYFTNSSILSFRCDHTAYNDRMGRMGQSCCRYNSVWVYEEVMQPVCVVSCLIWCFFFGLQLFPIWEREITWVSCNAGYIGPQWSPRTGKQARRSRNWSIYFHVTFSLVALVLGAYEMGCAHASLTQAHS